MNELKIDFSMLSPTRNYFGLVDTVVALLTDTMFENNEKFF